MPIFQDDFDSHHHLPTQPALQESLSFRPNSPIPSHLSHQSLTAELCEGLVSDSPRRPSTPGIDDDAAAISSRAELIERLKKGESPTWIPNRHLESIFQRRGSPAGRHASSPDFQRLPSAVQMTPGKADNVATTLADERLQEGLSIGRPRSALHSGDFTNSHAGQERRPNRCRERVGSQLAPAAPWIATSPPRDFASLGFETSMPFHGDPGSFPSVAASPLSSSLSSSFAYHPPTSPLVQSESNEELDFPKASSSLDLSSRELDGNLRGLGSFSSTPFASPSTRPSVTSLGLHPGRREPYQAHQPRRSLASIPSFGAQGANQQSPALFRARRPSIGSDPSPLHNASMVGSYEESILRGRMSTTPSKPFDFLAQIGVLGKGKCKPSLRCPPHVTLPFAAVYYSYGGTSHGRSLCDDGPSPYVGQIDLENGLSNSEEESRSKRKARGRYFDQKPASVAESADVMMPDSSDPEDRPRPSRPKRRMGSPRTPPGGSYRIPEKGQVQIIIKNQNKTAVKLFLVPYDLSGMEAGTKTFIRQRSYSTGPVIENVPNPSETDAQSRPMLRYLVHLHICCPSKARFYLYKGVRVVFANRVPEGKEKLRIETTWPEPRFTPYKPIRVMRPPVAMTSGPGALLAAEKARRRRSLGVSFGAAAPCRALDTADGLELAGSGSALSIEPVPFRLPCREPHADSDASDSAASYPAAGLRSLASSQASRPSTKDSAGRDAGLWDASGGLPYEKLNRGDFGYGGHAFSAFAGTGTPGGTEGLLSRRLRSLGVNRPQPPESAEELA